MRPLYTIGVYGFDAEGFLATLQDNHVDLLVDIRRRRGVRGREYAFANSTRLQRALAESGIRYAHVIELAPDDAARRAQYAVDDEHHVAKRARTALSDAFRQQYEERTLAPFSWQELDNVIGDARRPALLCVESRPEACHRGLVASAYAREREVEVIHLMP